MKRMLALLLVGMLLLGVTGCAKKENATAGGWTKEETALTEEQQEIFAKAISGTEYEGYEAVSLMGTQVVAGVNYKFKCKDEGGSEKIMTVYCDLKQNCSVLSVN